VERLTTLSVKESIPVRTPAAVGAKVTFTVQAFPGLRLDPQSFASPKSPVAPILLMASCAAPALVSVHALFRACCADSLIGKVQLTRGESRDGGG